MLYQIIDSYNKDTGKGLPMGNQSSQWFALYYLDKLDQIVKEQLNIKYYVRYMDDGILFYENKEYLKYCLNVMQKQLVKDKIEFNEKHSFSIYRKGRILWDGVFI